jgi:cytochrome P450
VTTVPGDLPLNDATFYASEPFDTYRLLRDHAPVYWCELGGFWAVSRHEDAFAVQTDPKTFCNGHGMTMRGGELDNVKGGEVLITMDAPEHTYQRKLISRHFSQQAISGIEPRIRAIAEDLVEQVSTDAPLDFVDELAAKLPVIVIAELLGVPVEDRKKFVTWSNASVGVADPEYADLQTRAMLEQYEYFEEILAQRLKEPRDDLLTHLVQAEQRDENFSHLDLLSLCFLLLAAGNETTRNLISLGVRALADHPDQMADMRATGNTRCAVEELLRYCSPVIHMARTATTDTEIAGQAIRSGDQVVLLYGSANHDERLFGDTAEELVVRRNPNPHLSFGFGVHYCLGSSLARVEARVLLDAMLQRFSGWDVVGPVERLRSTMILGIKHLPLVLQA